MLDFSEVYVDLKLNVCMGHGDHVPWVTLRVAPGFQALNFKAKTLTKKIHSLSLVSGSSLYNVTSGCVGAQC